LSFIITKGYKIMIKNKIKLSLATAMMIATTSYAGVVTAPNINNLEISGDIELKQVKEKTGNKTVDKRTAEVNLHFDAKSDSGLEIHTTFKAFDGTQAQSTAGADGTDDGFKTKEAYAVVPFMDNKAKVVAGLAPNNTYGTDAFENGGESWKAALFMPIAKGVKVGVVSKIENEEEADSNKGDSGATAIRVDAKMGDFMLGAKYAKGYKNKGDGKVIAGGTIDQDNTEKECTTIDTYITGEVSGVSVGAEYITKKVDLIGANKTNKPKGYYLSANKEFGDLTAGIAYINLSKGMKGGDDFAPGMITDGTLESSATKDTTAIVVPLEYAVNEQVTATATYISANVMGDDAKEFDIGASYAVDDNVELSVGYGKYTQDNADDQTNIEVAIAITF
jgi:hypothetical protein